jgi:formylglycine-generating enzyme required for sulfatase activity
MALVTLEGTRARRNDQELSRSTAGKHSLEALVKARLLVARDAGDGVSYEVAHEALLKGWSALRRWLDEHRESREARQRLELATTEWIRLGKSRDTLWGTQQLAEIALLEPEDIGPKEAEFLDACRHALQRKQQVRRGIAVLVPALALLLYGGYEYKQRRDLRQRVDGHVQEAMAVLAKAQKLNGDVERLRKDAFAAFDSQKRDEGEAKWAQVLEQSADVDDLYARSSQALEAALTLDSSRSDVKGRLAEVLYDRALSADRDRNPSRLKDLLARLVVYDEGGQRMRQWNAPAHVDIVSNPAGATVTISKYVESKKKRLELVEERSLGTTPLLGVEPAPGSYLLTLHASGRTDVRYPVSLQRGEKLRLEIPLPDEKAVPAGYVYIPPGRFMFGTGANDGLRKNFMTAVPIHEIQSPGYLIAKYELTYKDWIEYLRALPPAERAKQRMNAEKGGLSGVVDLKELADGTWQLTLRPGEVSYSVRAGEKLVYKGRKMRAAQDWLKMPVGGIAMQEAEAYAAWLSASGRIPGAHLCTELEWERGARGADMREFPHGDLLTGDEANIDETYAKDPASVGPDEVGSYPATMSPFGLFDMTGNVFELVHSTVNSSEAVARGGGFFFSSPVGLIANRQIVAPSFRDPGVGMRVCGSAPR